VKFQFVTLKSSRNKWAETAVAEYVDKIGHFVPIELHEIKSKSLSRDSQEIKKSLEGEALLSHLLASDYVVIFTEDGHLAKDSIKFSERVVQIVESGKSRAVFIVGGPYGFSKEVRARANLMLSLSSLTMNHFVAQIVALEQIYRALTIWKNRSYHNV